MFYQNRSLQRLHSILKLASFALLSSLLFPNQILAQTTDNDRNITLPTLVSFYDQSKNLPGIVKNKRRKPLQTVKTIVLDPGHGGENDGAVGVAHQYEKRLTLQLAFALRDALHKFHPEITVLLTRYEDKTLKLVERIAFANQHNADLFLSLHYNAATHNRALGFEAFFLDDDVQKQFCKNPVRSMTCEDQQSGSELLASEVLASFERHHPNMINRGLKHANFGVLRGARMPAVVVEAGFLTHPVEGLDIVKKSHRDETVAALVDAIERFDSENDVFPKPES